MTGPAIVIAAHDRPHCLRRLLSSVVSAEVETETPLVISIDGGGANRSQVVEIAESFEWEKGPKSVIEHEPIGLVAHFLACGDLTIEHDSVILLEDDLIVAPSFYQWAQAALAFAAADERLAGISLATPFFDGYRHLPFEPVDDGADGIYVQVPWYDGMAWTSAMWQHFRDHNVDPSTPLHDALLGLADDEWFPDAMRYLIETDRYYLLPRHGQASNTGAVGAHFDEATDYFQVPLTMRAPETWRFHSLDDSLAVYDDRMELTAAVMLRLVPELAYHNITAIELAIDLLGTRDLASIDATHVITTRPTSTSIKRWGASLHPLVANLTYEVEGNAITLAKVQHVDTADAADKHALATLQNHASRGRDPSTRDAARQLVRGMRRKLTRG